MTTYERIKKLFAKRSSGLTSFELAERLESNQKTIRNVVGDYARFTLDYPRKCKVTGKVLNTYIPRELAA